MSAAGCKDAVERNRRLTVSIDHTAIPSLLLDAIDVGMTEVVVALAQLLDVASGERDVDCGRRWFGAALADGV